MKTASLLTLLSVAVLAGMLFAGVQSRATNTDPVPKAEAAMSLRTLGGGGLTSASSECPGGAKAVCVACSGIECVKACVGGYTCTKNNFSCAAPVDECETSNPKPDGSFAY